MPLLYSPGAARQEPDQDVEPHQSLGDRETPARRSVRSKRRESLSSTMTRTNELPKPRPVDLRLFPQALPFLAGHTPETPELPSRYSRMARRSSMPNSLSYKDDVPKPRPLDTSLLPPTVAMAMPLNVGRRKDALVASDAADPCLRRRTKNRPMSGWS